jgi:TolA protein
VRPKAESSKASAEAVKIKAKAKPSVDEALKKIEKKVERKQGEAMVASSIDDLKKKLETERQARGERVSRLKEEIGSRPATAKPQETRAALKPQSSAALNPAGGASKANLEAKYPAYYGVIRDKVQDNWIYPEGLKDNKISVIVSIKIARTGRLLDVSVEKSSGDPAFDSSLLKAVRKAAPFPPLPVDLEGSFLETGLRFCPGCVQ